jgi:N-methylhydantoinase A
LRSIATGLGLRRRHGRRHPRARQPEHGSRGPHAVDQGEDLRGVTVLAFGGAGPIHVRCRRLLDSPRVIFPVNASVLNRSGTLVSPVRIDLARSMVRSFAAISRRARRPARRPGGRRVLATRAFPVIASVSDTGSIALPRAGQQLTIWVGDGEHWPAATPRSSSTSERHRRVYGLTIPDVTRQNSHVALVCVPSRHGQTDREVGETHGEPRTIRGVRFDRMAGALDTPVYRRVDSAPAAPHQAGHRRGARRRPSSTGGSSWLPTTARWSPRGATDGL